MLRWLLNLLFGKKGPRKITQADCNQAFSGAWGAMTDEEFLYKYDVWQSLKKDKDGQK